MKLKLKSRRLRSIEELWAVEDEFPAVCGPSPVSYAARYGFEAFQALSGAFAPEGQWQRQASNAPPPHAFGLI